MFRKLFTEWLLCQGVCHELDRSGPCPYGAHIHSPCAEMQKLWVTPQQLHLL